MIVKKYSGNGASQINTVDNDMQDEDALADGMIPDSRIVKLIDELEDNDDSFDNGDDAEVLKSLGLG